MPPLKAHQIYHKLWILARLGGGVNLGSKNAGLFISMHRHTGQGSAATADPVSSATVKRRSLLPLSCENKEQNASRFGICAGFRLGARYRSLGRNDAESLGFGRNEQPCKLRGSQRQGKRSVFFTTPADKCSPPW